MFGHPAVFVELFTIQRIEDLDKALFDVECFASHVIAPHEDTLLKAFLKSTKV